jgi:hypothetical protein
MIPLNGEPIVDVATPKLSMMRHPQGSNRQRLPFSRRFVYGAITFQQSGVFGVCLDIGHEHAGAMVGLMNTSSQVGGLLSSVAYGYIVARFGSYDAPFVPMAALLFLGSLLWLKIDASEELTAELRALPAPLGA